MISFRNATRLALKKLKVRRMRTLISILAATTLFGVAAFFLIFSNVFLDSIFQFHQGYFKDGKVYVTVEFGDEQLLKSVQQVGGKVTKIDNYNLRFDQNMGNFVVKDHPALISTSFIEVYEDGHVLDRFKLADQKYQHTMPVFVRDNVAATLTGVSLGEIDRLWQKSTNFVFTAEGEDSNLEFEIIGLIPTINNQNASFKSDYYSKFVQYFSGVYQQDQLIVRQQDFARIQDYYELSKFQTGTKMIAEFTNLNQAADFINKNNICFSFSGCVSYGFTAKPAAQGVEIATNRLSILEFRKTFNSFMFWVSIVLIIISAFILLGTFSRVFLDEQKAAATFEAIGATKLDIWKIYLIYSLLLALFVAIVTQIIGYAGAFILDILEAPAANSEILKSFRLSASEHKLTMFGLYLPALWISLAAFIPVIISFMVSARHITAKNIMQKLKD